MRAMDSELVEGFVVSWRDNWGFLRRRGVPVVPDGDVFCHQSSVVTEGPMRPGLRVRFRVVQAPKGPRAEEVELIGSVKRPDQIE
jgi:cold shock CspA family protein